MAAGAVAPPGRGPVPDIRRQIFAPVRERMFQAVIVAEASGVVSGIQDAAALAQRLGVRFVAHLADAQETDAGQEIATVTGPPPAIVQAEQELLGALSKTSGVATRARRALQMAAGRLRIVCGAFKKMPPALRVQLRRAVIHGGLDLRMAPQPFVYLDKNYVRMLGGVSAAMDAVAGLPGPVVIQIRGELVPIDQEAVTAARLGADTLMVDTGQLAHVAAVSRALRRDRLRQAVKLAFAGNLGLEDLDAVAACDVDAVDIGYNMVDAPCLPMRFDVVGQASAQGR